jgi:hypothetical protein
LKIVLGKCENGYLWRNIVLNWPCRFLNGTTHLQLSRKLPCSGNSTTIKSNEQSTEKRDIALTVAVAVAVILIILLLSLVVIFMKRNRTLRGRLFTPGKTFKQVSKDEDHDELVDNMENHHDVDQQCSNASF